MKKTLLIILALILTALCVFACAEEETVFDPYEVAAVEMMRQLDIRAYNPARSITSRNSGINQYNKTIGLTGPESMENYPNGLVLDRDNNCVIILTDSISMMLFCSEEEDAAEITAGFALLCGLYCADFDFPDMWELQNGEFVQHDFSYTKRWLFKYLDIGGQRDLFSWTAFNKYQQNEHNMMARIRAVRTLATAVDDWYIYDGLLYEYVPDSVIVDHPNHYILVQTASKTYVFLYAEYYDDPAIYWMISSVHLAGTELYNLDIYQIWPDDDTEHTSGWTGYEEMKNWYINFEEYLWVPGVETKAELIE